MTPVDLIISENFTFSILKVFELFNRNVCQMFVYKNIQKQLNTLKISLLFKNKYKLYGRITRGFIGSRMRNFQGNMFI